MQRRLETSTYHYIRLETSGYRTGDEYVHTTGDEYIRVPRGQEASTYDRRQVHTSRYQYPKAGDQYIPVGSNFSVMYHLNITCSFKQDLSQQDFPIQGVIYGLLLYAKIRNLRVRWNSPSEYLDKMYPLILDTVKKDPPH